MSPTPRWQTEGQTFALRPDIAVENLSGVRILMSKPRHFPCTAGALEKYLSRTLARLSPTLPHRCVYGRGGGVVTNDCCIISGAVEIVTCSRPQLKAPQLRIEPGIAETRVNHSTAPLNIFIY